MFKIVCLLLVCVTLGNAVERTLEVTEGNVIKGKHDSAISITESDDGETNITYNSFIASYWNRLRATLTFTSIDANVTRQAEIPNLCIPLKIGSFAATAQLFILETIANAYTCPIRKGTSVTYSVPYNFRYKVDRSSGCGPFRAEFKIFRKTLLQSLERPIMTVESEGNVTGC